MGAVGHESASQANRVLHMLHRGDGAKLQRGTVHYQRVHFNFASQVQVTASTRIQYRGILKYAYGRLDLMVTDLLSLGIAAEMIGRFGYPHAAVGNATIEGQCQPEPDCESEHLVVGNIGSSGYDGVRMSVPYYVRQPEGIIIGLIIYTDPADAGYRRRQNSSSAATNS